MTPARPGPRPEIATYAILEAVATRGRRWTAAFRDAEILALNEAVDRELLNGNLKDGHTLSAQGERTLAEHLGHPNDRASIDVRVDHACREHDPCWTLTCVRCETVRVHHITDDEMEVQVQKIIAGHVCLGRSRIRTPRGDAARSAHVKGQVDHGHRNTGEGCPGGHNRAVTRNQHFTIWSDQLTGRHWVSCVLCNEPLGIGVDEAGVADAVRGAVRHKCVDAPLKVPTSAPGTSEGWPPAGEC